MPIPLTVTVEEPDRILHAGSFGAASIIRLQVSATKGGTYADVSGTGSTPTKVVTTGTRSYEMYDPSGDGTKWYRTRFESADATRLSVDWVGDALWATRAGHAPFQPAPEGSGLICSLWDVKQELGETSTDPNRDESILEHIRAATDTILWLTQRQLIRSPAAGTETWTEDVESRRLTRYGLLYPKGIATLTTLEVAYGSQPETSGTYTTVPAAEWMLRPTESERSHGWPATEIVISDTSSHGFTIGRNTVRLTGARGWDTVPIAVQQIGVRAVTGSYMAKGSGAGGVVAAGPNGSALILRNISPADYDTLVSTFRIPVLG